MGDRKILVRKSPLQTKRKCLQRLWRCILVSKDRPYSCEQRSSGGISSRQQQPAIPERKVPMTCRCASMSDPHVKVAVANPVCSKSGHSAGAGGAHKFQTMRAFRHLRPAAMISSFPQFYLTDPTRTKKHSSGPSAAARFPEGVHLEVGRHLWSDQRQPLGSGPPGGGMPLRVSRDRRSPSRLTVMGSSRSRTLGLSDVFRTSFGDG